MPKEKGAEAIDLGSQSTGRRLRKENGRSSTDPPGGKEQTLAGAAMGGAAPA